jgi:DNA-binding SARP family transcriptional activator/TolB-like protein
VVTLTVLGGVVLERDGAAVVGRAAQRRRLALLAILAAHARGISRDRVLALLWPEAQEERARALLSDALSALRKALGDDALLTVGDDLRLNPGCVRTDLGAFEAALDAGDAERAVAAYAGPFLDGVHVSDAPEFDRWADEVRARVQRRYAEALAHSAAARERDGDAAGAVVRLRALAALDPGDARATVRRMCALERAGNVPAALRAAQVHAALMRDEAGRGPAPEVTELAERLRREPASPASGAGPDPGAAASSAAPAGRAPSRVGAEVETTTDRPAPAPSAAPAPALPSAPAPTSRAGFRESDADAGPPRRRVRPTGVAIGVAVGAALATGVGVAVGRYREAAATDATHSGARGRAGGEVPPGEVPPAQAPDAPARVAVLPFVVRGTVGSAYLSEAVASLLAAKLDGAGRLQSVDANLVLARAAGPLPRDPGAAVALGRALGATYVVIGNAVEAGGRLQLAAALYDTRGAGAAPTPLADAVAEDGADSVFRAVDTLTVRLLAAERGRAGHALAGAAALSTTSLPALKHYLAGEEAYRDGRFVAAGEAFEAATRLDPTFALAFVRLAAARGWGAEGSAAAASEAAMRHADRLPPRYRAVATAAVAQYHRRHVDEAERLTRAATERYPDEPEHWVRLGELLIHENAPRGRPITEARAPFERAVALLNDARQAEPLFHLIQFAASDGRRADLDSLARRLLALQPRSELAASVRAARAAALVDTAELARIAGEIRAGRAVETWRSALGWAAANTPDARALAPLLTALGEIARTPEERADVLELGARYEAGRGRWRRARAALGELAAVAPRRAATVRAALDLEPEAVVPPGELRAARDALAEALARDPDGLGAPGADVAGGTDVTRAERMRAHYLLGALESRLGAPAAAHAEAEWIEGAARRAPALWEGAYASALRARVLADRGEWTAALAAFGPRYPEHLPLRRLLRAELLEHVGQDAEALRWYATNTGEGIGIFRLAPTQLRMARLLDRLGDPRGAAAHRAVAAVRWRDADPELHPRVRVGAAGAESP